MVEIQNVDQHKNCNQLLLGRPSTTCLPNKMEIHVYFLYPANRAENEPSLAEVMSSNLSRTVGLFTSPDPRHSIRDHHHFVSH